MKQKYKDFIIELKDLIKNQGRTNIITPQRIDRLFVEHGINMRELENEPVDDLTEKNNNKEKIQDDEE